MQALYQSRVTELFARSLIGLLKDYPSGSENDASPPGSFFGWIYNQQASRPPETRSRIRRFLGPLKTIRCRPIRSFSNESQAHCNVGHRAGDAAYTQQALLEQTVDGVSPNSAAALRTLEKILAYARSRPTVYLPSHDPEAMERLNLAATISSRSRD
jgi:hypothetical protein